MISTQEVEASVDLDFDIVVRDIAAIVATNSSNKGGRSNGHAYTLWVYRDDERYLYNIALHINTSTRPISRLFNLYVKEYKVEG